MGRWLFKSEPGTWSWADQLAAGDRGTEWSGVRNAQARNSMQTMAVGDRGFFYHSQSERAVVGVVEVCGAPHRDSTAGDDPRWICVDIRAVASLPRAVSLEAIRREALLGRMVLVRNSRLSVQPVTEDEWAAVCALGGLDPATLGERP